MDQEIQKAGVTLKRMITVLILVILLSSSVSASGPGLSEYILKATDDDGYVFRSTSLGNYVTDTIRQAAGTDFAFLPSDLMGLNLAAGTVDNAGLELSLPRDEPVYIVSITVPQLRQVLELSCSHLTLDATEQIDEAASAWGGFLQLSGLRVTYNVPALVGARVYSVMDMDRQELDLTDGDTIYTAAVPASMLEGSYGYERYLSADAARLSVGTLRQLVAQRIDAEGISQQWEDRRITLDGARENEIIDYFPPYLILFVVVLFAVFGGYKWRRSANFER